MLIKFGLLLWRTGYLHVLYFDNDNICCREGDDLNVSCAPE